MKKLITVAIGILLFFVTFTFVSSLGASAKCQKIGQKYGEERGNACFNFQKVMEENN